MGANDPETPVAQRIAETLGLSMLTIPRPPGSATAVLERARMIFACPFVDHSCAPMTALAQAVVGEFGNEPRTVLDGTGADGAFGLFPAVPGWQKLYALPHAMRRIAGTLYKAGGYAFKTSGTERRLRLLRRASQMPLITAAVAQNPLHGIAYHFDDAVAARVLELMQDVVRRPMPGAPLPHAFSLIDLLITCAGIFAQKDKSIFDDSPHSVAYPYLQPSLVRFALQHGHLWTNQPERKIVLKTLLARHIPRELIYRPKSGFVAPLAQLFAEEGVLRLMDAVTADPGVLAGHLDLRVWSRLRAAAAARHPLPPQTYTFLWGTLFVSSWMRA
jgi:asparagine synthase (glutamine-hydrolysing)